MSNEYTKINFAHLQYVHLILLLSEQKLFKSCWPIKIFVDESILLRCTLRSAKQLTITKMLTVEKKLILEEKLTIERSSTLKRISLLKRNFLL